VKWRSGIRGLAFAIVLVSIAAVAQINTEVLGSHDLSPRSTSPVTGSVSAACLYCHAPHSGVGGLTPL